jgi:hypothetical protein
MRRALEIVGLLTLGADPNTYVNDAVKEIEPNYPVMTPEGAFEVSTMLNKTAQGAAMLVNLVMTYRERDGGPSVADQITELGALLDTLPDDGE